MSRGLFVDASALCAIVLNEPERELFKQRIADAPEAVTSALALFETVLAIQSRRRVTFDQAERDVDDLVTAGRIKAIPITAEIGRLAINARARYGKGTGHRVQLNMGDCFAYACARAHGVPLLYKGDDFVHTDLA
ncbi:type II toxin-antitoxin system VapC family toxin [Methylopila henanensis]|uniref:Ribonuclease VapC n=1 Tax=Methylopila henanensis TaxID=873516 RepID=A0ABW4K8K9_9HYPH